MADPLEFKVSNHVVYRLAEFRQEQWAAVCEYYRRKHDMEQDLAAVVNALEEERRVAEAVQTVLNGNK